MDRTTGFIKHITWFPQLTHTLRISSAMWLQMDKTEFQSHKTQTKTWYIIYIGEF